MRFVAKDEGNRVKLKVDRWQMTGRMSTDTDDHLWDHLCLKAFYKFRNEKEVIPIAFGSAIPLLS